MQCFNQLSQQANWQLVIKLVRYIPKATCNNSQNCWANNFGNYCVRVGSGVQTDATTPRNIGTYNASWKRYHPYDFGDSSCAMRLRGPNNVGRAVQTDPTLLCHASAIMKQQKCWELLAPNFAQQLPTTRNNMQQVVQTDVICNIQQCWELLPSNVASVCTGLYVVFKCRKELNVDKL